MARRNLEFATSLEELTQGEFLVLRRIRLERDESESKKITMFKAIKISEYLSMPAPAISRILNSLESRKLITRHINTTNRRSIVISLTDEGKKALDKAEEKINKFARGLATELGKDNTLELIKLLEIITCYCKKTKSHKGVLDEQ